MIPIQAENSDTLDVFNRLANTSTTIQVTAWIFNLETEQFVEIRESASVGNTAGTLSIPLPRCEVHNVSVTNNLTGNDRYKHYAEVHIKRDRGGNVDISTPIDWGYVSANMPLGYPVPRREDHYEGLGQLKVIGPADPSAGSELSQSIPTNELWEFLFIEATWTNDASGSNLVPGIKLTTPASKFWHYFANVLIGNGNSLTVRFARFGYDTYNKANFNMVSVDIPPADDQLTLATDTINFTSGDTITNVSIGVRAKVAHK